MQLLYKGFNLHDIHVSKPPRVCLGLQIVAYCTVTDTCNEIKNVEIIQTP